MQNVFSVNLIKICRNPMGEKENVYRILVGRPEVKRPLGRPRRRWVDNIKLILVERGPQGLKNLSACTDEYQEPQIRVVYVYFTLILLSLRN
jgi:hypothetical protein